MRNVNRRDFLKYSGAGGVVFLAGMNPLVSFAMEANENVREIFLEAGASEIDLGSGKTFKAMTYNGQTPGPEIRVRQGERLRVSLRNNLAEETTIHWHGLPVPNAMDGVPDVTQDGIKPGETFVYDFIATIPGTYMYHSHALYQLDQGLYGALIIEPAREELSYDREQTILLEDWAMVDGAGPEASRNGRLGVMIMNGVPMTMGGMMPEQHEENHPLLEPFYDAYTVNGSVFQAAAPVKVKKGEKLRLRLINSSSSTIYTFRIAGHGLTITHADGRPVEPLAVDAVRIGMGERYDVLLHADNPGRWLMYNLQDDSSVGGKPLGQLLYDSVVGKEFSNDSIAELRLNEYEKMSGKPESAIKLVGNSVDKSLRMVLGGGMMGNPYWSINGNVYPDSRDIIVKRGDRIRFEYINRSMMAHPMHLHGQFFEVVGSGGKSGQRLVKDTLIVPPWMGRRVVEFVAANPGNWFHHCHHLYHVMGGMANIVKVTG